MDSKADAGPLDVSVIQVTLGEMMKRLLIVLLVLVLASLACGSSTPSTPEDYQKEYGGKVEVYTRILTLTDCTSLQAEFDQADANLKIQEPGTPQYKWGIGYMKASDQRMKEIGCYE